MAPNFAIKNLVRYSVTNEICMERGMVGKSASEPPSQKWLLRVVVAMKAPRQNEKILETPEKSRQMPLKFAIRQKTVLLRSSLRDDPHLLIYL